MMSWKFALIGFIAFCPLVLADVCEFLSEDVKRPSTNEVRLVGQVMEAIIDDIGAFTDFSPIGYQKCAPPQGTSQTYTDYYIKAKLRKIQPRRKKKTYVVIFIRKTGSAAKYMGKHYVKKHSVIKAFESTVDTMEDAPVTNGPDNVDGQTTTRMPSTTIEKPGVDMEKPGDDMKKPGVDMKKPGDDMENPGDDMEKPGDDMKKPGDDMKKPGVGTKKPGDDMENPGDDMEKPGDDMKKPKVDQKEKGLKKPKGKGVKDEDYFDLDF